MMVLNRINVATNYIREFTDQYLNPLSEYKCFTKYAYLSNEFSRAVRRRCYKPQEAVCTDLKLKSGMRTVYIYNV